MPGGSKFEGIGVDERRGPFYVSETTGGEIHRGTSGSRETEHWLAGDGTDGRFTARGITVDPRPGLHRRRAERHRHPAPRPVGLLARRRTARRVARARATRSSSMTSPSAPTVPPTSPIPMRRRCSAWRSTSGWRSTCGPTPPARSTQAPGSTSAASSLTADRIGARRRAGQCRALWRFDLRRAVATRVDTGGADLTDADGLVRGRRASPSCGTSPRALATLQPHQPTARA